MATAWQNEAVEREVQLREDRFEQRLDAEETSRSQEAGGSGAETSSSFKDVDGFYTALGLGAVGPQASTADIKAAFRARAWEEDMLWPSQGAKRDGTYTRLVTAYRTLRDYKSRLAYDRRCLRAAAAAQPASR